MKYFLSISLVLASSLALAHRHPHGATEACQNQSKGSQCFINTPRGELQGICEQPPRGRELVCRPDKHGHSDKHSNKNSRTDKSGHNAQGHRFSQQENGNQQNDYRRNSYGKNRPEKRSDGKRGNASQGGGAKTRRHTIVQSSGDIQEISTNTKPITHSLVDIRVRGQNRVITANGISDHVTGRYPNQGNPHEITEQNYVLTVPANPQLANTTTPLGMHDFGIGLNGVPFDPAAAEWYQGNRESEWQYNAMSGAISLGLDKNNAHVQPTGAYHYHGLPNLLLSELGLQKDKHSPLVGWAADGFPIYALYGYDSANAQKNTVQQNTVQKNTLLKNTAPKKIAQQTSSFQLKQGKRPSGGNNPGGYFDGTFIADYEYKAGSGTLDECNGKVTRTPEFPQGTYAYFLTESFPIIPRCYKGQPSRDFTHPQRR